MALITCRILAVCLAGVAFQLVVLSSQSSCSYIDIPPPSPPLPSNSKLQKVIKLGEGFVKKSEDVAFDKNGVLYTATRDGFVKRLHKNGTWENWKNIKSGSLLGVCFTRAGDFIVCDADQGLLKVNEEGVTVLTSHVNGSKIRFVDDVIESSDGILYFSDASTKFGFKDWKLDILETKPHGRLLKYDPCSNTTSVVLEGLAFANGVALSARQDYLVVCETWEFRCLKYWLKGKKKGKTEIFIDKLPGRPDNINLAPDGSFWIALLQIVPTWTSHKSRTPMAVIGNRTVVLNVGSNGKIIRSFDDPTGKVMKFVTSAVEFEGNLYFGNLENDFVGKLPLPKRKGT